MKDIVIRDATVDDLHFFFGRHFNRTVRAWTVFFKGERVATAGLMQGKQHMLGFSEIIPDLVVPDITVWRVTQVMIKKMTDKNLSFYVLADHRRPRAAQYLERLGFQHVRGCGFEYEVYRWEIL